MADAIHPVDKEASLAQIILRDLLRAEEEEEGSTVKQAVFFTTERETWIESSFGSMRTRQVIWFLPEKYEQIINPIRSPYNVDDSEATRDRFHRMDFKKSKNTLTKTLLLRAQVLLSPRDLNMRNL